MIRYSIVIPHKNIPSLLQRCLDSIPRREDIRIIVVDDDSSPEIVDFASFPGLDDPAVEVVFTKEGKGAGYARNVGLERATGEWLLFADADDFFNPGFLDSTDRYRDSEADLVFFNFSTLGTSPAGGETSRLLHYESFIEAGAEERLRYESYVPWAKMIRRELVCRHAIRFDETPASNDVMFAAYVGLYAGKVAICRDRIYCSVVRGDSLWYGMAYPHLLARIEVACRYNRLMRKIGRIGMARIYSYGFVARTKVYGRLAYLRAFWLYVRKENGKYVGIDLWRLVKAKVRGRGI